MTGMFLGRVIKDDYIIEINETRLPPQPGEEGVDCTLESRRRVPLSKRHARELEIFLMRGKCCLLDIFRRNLDLPISAIAVERRENLRISKGVTTLIHTG
jgi:hypothetical protein